MCAQVCETEGQYTGLGRSASQSCLYGVGRGDAGEAPAGKGFQASCILFLFRSAIAAGLYGYNGVLVGLLMAVFSAKGDYHWWLLLPVALVSVTW